MTTSSIAGKVLASFSLICCISAGENRCVTTNEDVVIGKHVTFASKILEEDERWHRCLRRGSRET
jgi:hypothetical protein